MKVYIAGAVENHPSPELVRRNIKNYGAGGIDWVDPLDFEPEGGDPQDLIDEDIGLVEWCDALLVYWNPELPSWGTASEVYHASQIEDMPIIVWQTDPAPSKPKWLVGMSEEIVGDLAAAVAELQMLGQ